MSGQNLIFARMLPKKPSLPLFLLTGCGKGANMFSQLHYLSYFAPVAFYLFLKVKASKLLVDPGHLQEELVEGRHDHHYRRACRRCPGVDRALQKNTYIADDHAKK
jgi:hypothetical protein